MPSVRRAAPDRRAGRRPALRGRAARPPRPAAAAPAAHLRVGGPFTGRAAILGLVVFTLVFSAALPVREYFAQRSEISRLEQEQAAALERVEALEQQKRQLQDPAYIAAEARRRLHMARPGEVTYVLLTPEPAPEAEAEAAREEPWWSQVWDSVQTADRPPKDAESPSE